MDNEDYASESVLRRNDAFVRKLLSSRRSSVGESSRHGYFSDKQGVVPFIWEKEPGIPKYPTTMDNVSRIIPPPRLRHGSKPSIQHKSCFLMKPWRATKHKKDHKGNHHDAPDQSTASSVGFFNIAKGILEQLF